MASDREARSAMGLSAWIVKGHLPPLPATVSRARRLLPAPPRHRRPRPPKSCVFSPAQNAQWAATLRVLHIFRALYGHLRVPQSFTVPSHDLRWPRDLCGAHVGHMVKNLRARAKHWVGPAAQERVATLDALGFVWALRARGPYNT
ncbi:hypothetical protein SDRG_08767 [Saprolegnia diclina VS20]|uniref:Helicase-associated domain-containing protein n=1 Tax=Saprolegnia diclina (strain VS20) TaxID=1156394 RepID=T0RMU3_SAPDV|nr:hypothetical protein SDRG_08767 [Saprolegnia diclina VS20]EQC33663.1 hypothetical protein SDRG_08767 [Saprolegnia diclina VS20]|eukprot:XP_008612886.1 hypothetical protein SDRG_08767 [Saprolegnia diclina VS20]